MIQISSVNQDDVIKGKFITAFADYRYSIENLCPLINKLQIQRRLQNERFYQRLEEDLSKGCIMPPLTLALIAPVMDMDNDEAEVYINDNIKNAFVLDGIQRLNTLQRAASNGKSLDLNRPLFLNIIICQSMDNLLYRMITLNNGQKPMSARHQIEILTENLDYFHNLSLKVETEKQKSYGSSKDFFSKSDLVQAYIAFLSDSTNIDNQKIIEEKMDELIAERIMHSRITEDGLEFSDVIGLISRLSEEPQLLIWFQIVNNLIGFSVGIRKSYSRLIGIDVHDFQASVDTLESAFSSFDTSKIRIGQQRRKVVAHFIANYDSLWDLDANQLLDVLSEVN